MTSEVVIFNNQGVALAADSAVTIGNKKTYNSAIKLFSLSHKEPVGIMVFGNANILNVPWELIIKSFRTNHIKTNSYPYLIEYAESFIEYVSDCNFFSEDSQNKWLRGTLLHYFSFIRESIINEVHIHVRNNGEIDLNTTRKITSSVIDEHLAEISERDFSGSFDENSEVAIRKSILNTSRETISTIFENLPITKATTTKLYSLSARLITRKMFSRKDISGIVIAGYGNKEIFPQVVTYKVAGVFKDKLRYVLDTEKTYCENNNGLSAILAFADYQMVDTFMKGTNNKILDFIFEYLLNTLEHMPELISKIYKLKKLKPSDEYKKMIIKIVEECFDAIDSHMKGSNSDPVMAMVAALPKDELAAMAESLVNLTAFKRKVSHTIESVGGPIDVAVISKGDGLVWVKRKHYFPAELNHNFFDNYGK